MIDKPCLTLSRLAITVSLAVFPACSSSSASADKGSDAGDAGGPTGSGTILLTQAPGPGGTDSSQTRATFYVPAGPEILGLLPIPPGCQTTTDGACQIKTCAFGGPDGGVPSPTANAGDVTISTSSAPVTLTPGADNVYAPASSAGGAWWAGGDQVTVSAAGGDVPAFSTQAAFPSKITVTAPALGQNSLPIDRSADLAFAWTGGGAGDVVVALPVAGPSILDAVVCSASAASGKLIVPATALGALGAGKAGIIVVARSASTVTSGGVAITVDAEWLIQSAGATLQ